MTAPDELLPVTQADCEAAADLIEQYWQGAGEQHDQMRKTAASYRAGHSQGVWAVAFARHRISHSLPGDGTAKPAAWMYDGPDGQHYISGHRDCAYGQLIGWGWTETPLYAALTPSPCPGDGMREALQLARDRLADMLMGDDGQAWKEAEKVLPIIDAALAPSALSGDAP